MPCVVTCVNVTKSETGVINAEFSDGSTLEFNDLAALKAAVVDADNDHAQCKIWLLAHWIRRDADATNVQLVRNKTLTFDLTSPQLLKVQ